MTRTVGHRLHGRIEVFAFADSIGEAFALENALKQVPAFASGDAPLPIDRTTIFFDGKEYTSEDLQNWTPPAPELSPEQEARMAAADPPEPIDVLNVEKAVEP